MYSDLDIRAYFITFTSYGTWLHGDERGSVDDEHCIPGLPFAPPNLNRESANRKAMKWPEFTLDAKARGIVHRTIREVCEHRGWSLIALNVRTNHVHVVVYAPVSADKVLNDLKAWTTRRLREAGCRAVKAPVWTEGGSKHKLFTAEAVTAAAQYTSGGQGPSLPLE